MGISDTTLVIVTPSSFASSGQRGDYHAARKFICALLMNAVPQRAKEIYPHYTCATDTENMRVVFDRVRNFILESNLVTLNL